MKEIRETGRGAKGVKLVDLAAGDKLLAVARVVEVKDEDVDTPPDEPASPGEEPPAE
ncbi:hypothetical protein D3C83_311480 [compost metagenome]